MTNFTITNISTNSVTYNGTTITPGNSFTVSSSQVNYAIDGCFLSDLAQGNCAATVCGTVISGVEAVRFMVAWAVANTNPQYNSTLPSLSNTQYTNTNLNQFGELATQFRNKYTNVTDNTTSTIKSGSGRLHGIMVNRNWTGGTVVVYDNTAGSGTVIATMDFGSPSGGLLSANGLPGPTLVGPLGLEFSTGLTVVTSGSTSNNITVLYQ